MIRLKRYELYTVPRCTRYSFMWNCLLITEIAELLFKVVLSTNNPTHQLTLTVTRRVPLVEQEQLTLPERGGRGRNRMVVGFTTTCAISAYHHKSCGFEPRSAEVYSIQHYVIRFVNDLWQISGFLRVLWFPPTIKLIATV